MMLEWLKDILGASWTEDIDEQVRQKIGKEFVSKKDFNEKMKLIGEHEKTIQEKTTELDNLRSSNTDVEALQQQLKDKDAAYASEIDALKLDFAVQQALQSAKAHNPATVMPLLEGFLKDAKLGDDGTVEGLEDKIKALQADATTAFLFAKDGTPQKFEVAGAEPGNPGNKGGKTAGSYEARLADARKKGDTTQAVAIINEAAAAGIQLM